MFNATTFISGSIDAKFAKVVTTSTLNHLVLKLKLSPKCN